MEITSFGYFSETTCFYICHIDGTRTQPRLKGLQAFNLIVGTPREGALQCFYGLGSQREHPVP